MPKLNTAFNSLTCSLLETFPCVDFDSIPFACLPSNSPALLTTLLTRHPLSSMKYFFPVFLLCSPHRYFHIVPWLLLQGKCQSLLPVFNLDLSTLIQTQMSNSKLDISLGLLCRNSGRMETHAFPLKLPPCQVFSTWVSLST